LIPRIQTWRLGLSRTSTLTPLRNQSTLLFCFRKSAFELVKDSTHSIMFMLLCVTCSWLPTAGATVMISGDDEVFISYYL
jgi:hypothetical protein